MTLNLFAIVVYKLVPFTFKTKEGLSLTILIKDSFMWKAIDLALPHTILTRPRQQEEDRMVASFSVVARRKCLKNRSQSVP